MEHNYDIDGDYVIREEEDIEDVDEVEDDVDNVDIAMETVQDNGLPQQEFYFYHASVNMGVNESLFESTKTKLSSPDPPISR